MEVASRCLQALLLLGLAAFAPGLKLPGGTRVLVVGGSGRVGGSTARAILRAAGAGVKVTVAGRSEVSYANARARWAADGLGVAADDERVSFTACDLNDASSMAAALRSHDVVVHTAGPFQGLSDAKVLKVLLSDLISDEERPSAYVDVCDDAELAGKVLETYGAEAEAKGVTAVLSTGTWPGASSLMAMELQRRLREEHAASTDALDFNFFTSGSGGAGATVLAATFLILGEDALTFKGGKPNRKPTCTDTRKIEFPGIGARDVQRLNLLEAWSSNRVLGVPNTQTFFGTAPFFWNALLAAMARFVPKDLLRDRGFGKALAAVSVAPVYAVDTIFGTANGIRVDASGTTADGDAVSLSAALCHDDLEACVGEAVHAFASAAATSAVPAGVHLPEMAFGDVELRERVLEGCAAGALGGGLRFFRDGAAVPPAVATKA